VLRRESKDLRAGMNTAFYLTIDRLLWSALETIEFLGSSQSEPGEPP
jgi:hypothetical protein